MTYEDIVQQFTEDLQFEALEPWCGILGVEYGWPGFDEAAMLLVPGWESGLRIKLAEAMMKVGEK